MRRTGTGVVTMAPSILRDFGTHLRDLWINRGRSLEDVAKAVGCSKAFLSQVERGQARPAPERVLPWPKCFTSMSMTWDGGLDTASS